MREPSEAAIKLALDEYEMALAKLFEPRRDGLWFLGELEHQRIERGRVDAMKAALRAAYAVDAREATDAKPSQR